jgi:hypothetical protein
MLNALPSSVEEDSDALLRDTPDLRKRIAVSIARGKEKEVGKRTVAAAVVCACPGHVLAKYSRPIADRQEKRETSRSESRRGNRKQSRGGSC